ncbi:MAG: DNA starvation/stationary phase protection protein [Burkholderiales bacterium]|nr:DNA starvation/stationary phase protection protein [Burkholderiales bacterium]
MLTQQFYDINDGITQENRVKIAESVAHLLADTYTLYLKVHNYHWNVTGNMFNTLHLMFEGHYTELALAVDLVAERIRALGFMAPGSYNEFAKLTKIKEHNGNLDAIAMIKDLIIAHEVIINTAREVLPFADKANDQVTLDLVTQRLQVHEKTVWMLRSLVV